MESLVRGCSNCVYGNCRKIGSRGPEDAPIVIIGESPSGPDLIAGSPFNGTGGDIIAKALAGNNIPIYYTSAISCPLPKKDPKILANVTRNCSSRLIEEIKKYPRKVIIALGNAALWSVTGNYNLKITQVRGQVFPTELAEQGIVAAVHPNFLIRGGGSFKKFQEDLQYAVAIAGGTNMKVPLLPEWTVLTTEAEVKDLAVTLRDQELVASDIETSGFSSRKDKILSLGFCFDPKHVYVVQGTEEFSLKPYGYDKSAQFVADELLHHLAPAIEHEQTKYIWHNGKFDVDFLTMRQLRARVDEDTMLLNYCLDETRGVHDLGQIGSDLLGMPDWKAVLEKYLPKKNVTYALISPKVLQKYLAYDISTTRQIYDILKEKVYQDPDLVRLYEQTLLPASKLLVKIQQNGFRFDRAQQQKNKLRLEAKLALLQEELHDLTLCNVNISSSQQVCALLYDHLGLKAKKRSSDAQTLEKLNHPAVDIISQYRTLNKQLTTYVNGMEKHIEDDELIHPNFLLHGTRTGRLACRQPNLQNIPRDSEMRAMFVAAPGYILIEADYSQAELRVLAVVSKDEAMMQLYQDPKKSIHKEMATVLYGIDYTEQEYAYTKGVNFGIVYGRTAYSLSQMFEIPVSEAMRMIDGWFTRFPGAHAFIKKCRMAPLKGTTLKTPFGRKCRPGLVTRENQNAVQNEFANFPHQSIASDLTLHSAIKIEPEINKHDAHICNMVHDSIIAQCPDEPAIIARVSDIMRTHMETTPKQWGFTEVPFVVDFKYCYSWGKAVELADAA